MVRPTSILQPTTPVLIVDDNSQYSKILHRMLEQAFGYTSVTVVDNPTDGYKLLTAVDSPYQLLFVDYRFPSGETGGEFLEKLYKEGHLGTRIAFLVTSEPNIDNLKQVLAAGTQGVIAKPFDRNELKRQLEKAERSLKIEQGDSF